MTAMERFWDFALSRGIKFKVEPHDMDDSFMVVRVGDVAWIISDLTEESLLRAYIEIAARVIANEIK